MGNCHVMVRALLCLLFVAVSALPYPNQDTATSFLQTELTGGYGSLNVTALTVNSGPARESQIVLGSGDSSFQLRLSAEGSFDIRHRNVPSFTVGPDGDVTIYGKVKSSGTVRIDGSLTFMGVSQWLLATHETFSQGVSGWSNATTSTCGSPQKKLLGGYGLTAGGEISKTFRQLPDHNEIRVKANFHFIDDWAGETAFAKLERQVVWTDIHDQMASKNGINICGAPAAESKFAVPIDVVIPHRSSSLTVSFGSTLSRGPLEASWAISDLQLFVRKRS
eukprot:c7478_g1_i1.p1 GENE.c7478_g1_i1~~c7478_g1_i1.p1  ORF type:complete len:278 (-),score=49.04 c7478_g1_i1:102-935(-)